MREVAERRRGTGAFLLRYRCKNAFVEMVRRPCLSVVSRWRFGSEIVRTSVDYRGNSLSNASV
jgi:hypothetical protein